MGEVIYQSNSLENGWDGTYKNVPCQSGVYIYVLNWTDINGQKHQKYGHVTLIR